MIEDLQTFEIYNLSQKKKKKKTTS